MHLPPLAFFQNLGVSELLIILFIILLLFGAKRLPELMRNLGKGAKEFKKGMRDVEEDTEKDEQKPPGP